MVVLVLNWCADHKHLVLSLVLSALGDQREGETGNIGLQTGTSLSLMDSSSMLHLAAAQWPTFETKSLSRRSQQLHLAWPTTIRAVATTENADDEDILYCSLIAPPLSPRGLMSHFAPSQSSQSQLTIASQWR